MKKTKDAPQPFDIKTYPYPQCRERHDWHLIDGNIDKKTQVGVRIEQCYSCSMKKITTMSLHSTSPGRYIRNPRYISPEGYSVAHGLSSFERGQIRMHNFLGDFKGNLKAKK